MHPLISVVVPTYRRHDLLERCLEAVAQQALPAEAFEVIVADDAASAETEQLVNRWSRRTSGQIRYLAVRHAHGPAAARNAGWRAARADVIAFTEEWKSRGATWAGRFVVERAGTGSWTLEVVAPDTRQRWSQSLDVPPGTTIETGVVRSARVTVRLLGPGGAGQQCPLVRLVEELQEHIPTKPRGLVGPDDRWAATNANLHQQKDVSRLLEWAEAVVHLQVVSRTGLLLPCSGFFVSPNVLMTAAH